MGRLRLGVVRSYGHAKEARSSTGNFPVVIRQSYMEQAACNLPERRPAREESFRNRREISITVWFIQFDFCQITNIKLQLCIGCSIQLSIRV